MHYFNGGWNDLMVRMVNDVLQNQLVGNILEEGGFGPIHFGWPVPMVVLVLQLRIRHFTHFTAQKSATPQWDPV
jgi:hypothetical protein